MRWLEAFKACFGHRAQELALRRYVQGLLSDSPRKSMEAIVARGTDPGGYQAFQHFITDAPWSADGVWRCLRAVLPEREGLVIFAGTSFPKPGTSSVGVARQYCGAVGKVANGQVAVTAALWTGLRAYLLGAALYVPEAVADRRRPRSGAASPGCPVAGEVAPSAHPAPAGARQRPHRHRRAGRCGVWRYRPVSGHVASVAAPLCGGDFLVADRVPGAAAPRAPAGRPAGAPAHPARPGGGRAGVHGGPGRQGAAAVAAISWRNRRGGRRWTVQCVALRVTPAHDWRDRRLAPEVWLLAERDTGATPRTKYFFVNLPATTSWPQLVRLAHQRWAIEQQYQELKTHLGLDHFEAARSRAGTITSCSPP